LGAFEAGTFGLEEVVVDSLFGVLGFQAVNLGGLGTELGLKDFQLALAGLRLGFQLSACFEFGFEECCFHVCCRCRPGAVGISTSTIALPVGAAP
jgi:hypothetical protein